MNIVVICIAILSCGLIAFLCQKYVAKTYSAIDAVLDNVLSKSDSIDLPMEDDSRLSKLAHKATKILQMNTMDVLKTKQEKEIIQGFISDMSHQMKTPLSGIAMYTDLLSEGNLSEEEQKEFLMRMKEGADKLQWMMDSLVKMSRLEVGAIELSPIPASIKQTISESIGMVLSSASEKNITIHTNDFEDALLLHDKKWTIEAMSNILENAVKYSNIGGEIKINIEALPIYAKISITDYGIGIAKEEWNSIFKRFYRGQKARDKSGVGLGLYLASMILEKQGGYILVDSKLKEYTTFSLFLQNCKN